MASTKETVAAATKPCTGNQELSASSKEPRLHTRPLKEEARMLLREPPRRATTLRQSLTAMPAPTGRSSRRTKLAYKNRWLISVDVVAALRRAGVDCDILLPQLYLDTPGLTQH